MKPVHVNQVGIIAPGMMNLSEAMPILQGEVPWQPLAMEKIIPELLPANERRRTTALIKLALRVGQDAIPSGEDTRHIATVLASSEGDLEISDKICRALLEDDKPVSPTQFHNSVHNAAAGYWAIAARSHQASVSLSAGDASFVAGLLEAVSQVEMDNVPVLLVAYDNPAPSLLDEVRHFGYPFATALLLSQQPMPTSLATLRIDLNPDRVEHDQCKNASLESLRTENPIAASLPLLEAICRTQTTEVVLPYLGNKTVKVQVCH